MNRTRQSGLADRIAVAVLATALIAGLAMAAETGREPAAASQIEDDVNPPAYVMPDANRAPFAHMLLND